MIAFASQFQPRPSDPLAKEVWDELNAQYNPVPLDKINIYIPPSCNPDDYTIPPDLFGPPGKGIIGEPLPPPHKLTKADFDALAAWMDERGYCVCGHCLNADGTCPECGTA